MLVRIVTLVAFLGIITFLVLINMTQDKYNKALKVGVNLDNLMLPIDPLNNINLTNAFFSNNLYSNLIDVDENNNYQPELASKYWFDPDQRKLFFEFENSRINASDAAFSLKRLVSQNRHLHTDFWNIICEVKEESSLCEQRIYVENNILVIKYEDQSKAQYIIPTLASVDYKIIPIDAFDSKDFKVAQIIDYTKTSGHYHLIEKENKYFFVRNSHAARNIYRLYELVNMNSEFLSSGNPNLEEVDVISSTVVLLEKSYKSLIDNGWNVFSTHNISIGLLVFSKKGVSSTTVSDRFNFARRLSIAGQKKVRVAQSHATVEFFQDFGQGFLNNLQLGEISLLRSNIENNTKSSITFGVKYVDKWTDFVNENKDIKIVKIDSFIPNLTELEQPDSYTMTNDVSFDLSLSLISYAANVGLLDMTKKEVDEFANLKIEAEKIAYINAVHFKTLKDCKIYPMWASPYHTAFKGYYEHNLSKFNSRTLLWKIH